MLQTHEGAASYEHSLDHHVEFFSKAGSLFEKRLSFYKGEESALSLFQKAWIVDKPLAFKLLLWLRDCRGGAGNRSASRSIYRWLAIRDGKWILCNLEWLPIVGRWDDFVSFFGTPIEEETSAFWAKAIKNRDLLAAKWAKRHYTPLQKVMSVNEAMLRLLLASIRKDHIVEHTMCNGDWDTIEFENVPSIALARYTNAFKRHCGDKFNKYIEDVKLGKKSCNAGVLFPHDCARTARNGDPTIADLQFEELPDYITNPDTRIFVIADTSLSMRATVSGSIQAADVSQSLALYISSRLSRDNPFYKMFMSFSDEGHIKSWRNHTFSKAINDQTVFGLACGTTRIDKALDTLLQYAKQHKADKEQMPNVLLIISDMQFTDGVDGYDDRSYRSEVQADFAATKIDLAMDDWEAHGYARPAIVYWNTAGYAGSPATVKHKNIALVSGFSPSILTAILSGNGISPETIMLKTLEKYNITVPEVYKNEQKRSRKRIAT